MRSNEAIEAASMLKGEGGISSQQSRRDDIPVNLTVD